MVVIGAGGGFNKDSRQQQPELGLTGKGLTGLPMVVFSKKVSRQWLDGKDKRISALSNTD